MPSKYTGSIHTVFPYLEPIKSKKFTREEGLKTKETLTQDQGLHTKNISIFVVKAPHSQKLIYSSPSKLTKIYIREPFAKPFCDLSPQTLHSIQEEFPLLYTKESKTHQKGRKEDSTRPAS